MFSIITHTKNLPACRCGNVVTALSSVKYEPHLLKNLFSAKSLPYKKAAVVPLAVPSHVLVWLNKELSDGDHLIPTL